MVLLARGGAGQAKQRNSGLNRRMWMHSTIEITSDTAYQCCKSNYLTSAFMKEKKRRPQVIRLIHDMTRTTHTITGYSCQPQSSHHQQNAKPRISNVHYCARTHDCFLAPHATVLARKWPQVESFTKIPLRMPTRLLLSRETPIRRTQLLHEYLPPCGASNHPPHSSYKRQLGLDNHGPATPSTGLEKGSSLRGS